MSYEKPSEHRVHPFLEMFGSERHFTPRYQLRQERQSRLSSRLLFVLPMVMYEPLAEGGDAAVVGDPEPVGTPRT